MLSVFLFKIMKKIRETISDILGYLLGLLVIGFMVFAYLDFAFGIIDKIF